MIQELKTVKVTCDSCREKSETLIIEHMYQIKDRVKSLKFIKVPFGDYGIREDVICLDCEMAAHEN